MIGRSCPCTHRWHVIDDIDPFGQDELLYETGTALRLRGLLHGAADHVREASCAFLANASM